MSIRSFFLVLIQFSSFIYFAIVKNTIAKENYLIAIQIIGLIIGLWGVLAMKFTNFNIQPEVKKGAFFVQTGPYRYIRNPMYTGLILAYGSAIISHYSTLNLLVYLVLVTSLILKIYSEEKYLSQRFGQDYLSYKKTTKRLIPYIY
jgi:protein-S-isoprenylcysteine O-methyltransferase Ste14